MGDGIDRIWTAGYKETCLRIELPDGLKLHDCGGSFQCKRESAKGRDRLTGAARRFMEIVRCYWVSQHERLIIQSHIITVAIANRTRRSKKKFPTNLCKIYQV